MPGLSPVQKPTIDTDIEHAVQRDPPTIETADILSEKNYTLPSVTGPSEPKPRGFLGFLVLIPPTADAKEYSHRTRWFLTTIISLGGLASPMGSTILMPVLLSIARHFHTSQTKVNLSVAFYSLSVAFCPLWWSYLSESSGRRATYLTSFFLLAIFNILAAVSVSIDMFIVMRVLAGGACASVQSVGAGSVADIWPPKERGQAMGIFFLGPTLGPLVSPIIGGALAIRWGWRSTQWFMVIYGTLMFFLMLFFLPETSSLKPKTATTTRDMADESEKKSLSSQIQARICKIVALSLAPLRSVVLLKHRPILATCCYTGIAFGSYYLVNISVQSVFSNEPYSFSTMIVGLIYIPSALGSILGSVLGGCWTDYVMRREAIRQGRYDEQGNLIVRPVDRMNENVWLAAVLFPAAMLWFGWTADKHVFWLVPCLSTFFYGFGMMMVSNVATTMLTEFVPKSSSTGVAVNNLFRNSLACVAAIITQPLINAIGTGWLFTIACILCFLSGIVLVLMKRNADKWSQVAKQAAKQAPR